MMRATKNSLCILFTLLAIWATGFGLPISVLAEDAPAVREGPVMIGGSEHDGFQTISGMQGLADTDETYGISTERFLTNLYRIAIIIAAVMAVIKLILAGAQYVLSGVVTKKENAKRDIRSALIGLLIILAAVTLLTQINPQITDMPQLSSLESEMSEYTRNTARSPQQQRIDIMCDDENGGCGEFSCVYADVGPFLSDTLGLGWIGTTIGFFTQATGLELAQNTLTCAVTCPWAGGEWVERSNLVPDSGKCIYPNNQETFDQAAVRAQEYLIQEAIDTGHASFADPTALPEGVFESDITNYPLINDSSAVGVYDFKTDYGIGENNKYGDIMFAALNKICVERKGGKQITSTIPSEGSLRFYCIK